MSVRSFISRAVAIPLLRAYKARASHGCCFSIPFPAWRALPDGVKHWLQYRVLGPGEACSWKTVADHDVLGRWPHQQENSWAISPTTRLFLWHLLTTRKPQRILEFGSGISTQIFALYAEIAATEGRSVSILSVDHDANWLNKTHEDLVLAKRDRHVHLVHAELEEQLLIGKKVVAYGISRDILAAASGEGFDLCLIDGPPGNVGRSGCLPLAAPLLRQGAVVLLDDAYRAGEQAAIDQWRSQYKHSIRNPRLFLADTHGLACFQWMIED
jgi:predicted O-methyltransferase YrrM